jgi:hypothetical protein
MQMKSKIGLALALALFALGINQANAAMIYFSCVGGNQSTTPSYFDLQVDPASGNIIGSNIFLRRISTADDKPPVTTCSISATSANCSTKGGLYKFSNISLSRISGHLSMVTGVPTKDDGAEFSEFDCKLASKKLF